MIDAIVDVGYEVGTASTTFNVRGMTLRQSFDSAQDKAQGEPGASCVAHVESALKELDGVTKATIRLARVHAELKSQARPFHMSMNSCDSGRDRSPSRRFP